MKTDSFEQISALIDGELDTREIDSIDQLLENSDTVSIATRWQLYGACMRHEKAHSSSELFGRICQKISSEPTALAPGLWRSSKKSLIVQSAAGFAVAASVATVVLFTASNLNLHDDVIEIGKAPEPTHPVSLLDSETNQNRSGLQLSTSRLATDDEFNRYLIRHDDIISSSALSSGHTSLANYKDE